MLAVVAIWAFAEAILFVLVADVPISWIAVRYGMRPALVSAFVAAAAATVGGIATFFWATTYPEAAAATIVALPGIDATMAGDAAEALRTGGAGAMLAGSLSGVPYKLYVLSAAQQGRDALWLLLVSPLVRLPRFLAVAALAGGIGKLLSRRLAMRARLAILGAFWVLFYAAYFTTMPA